MNNIFMHIDVNNAFLSWTAVDLLNNGYNIDIRNIPSIIGGDESKRHGIVLAKSMVAKKYGIKTAETIKASKIKCKNLKVFSPNYDLYNKMSADLFRLISKYTPDIERLSIDECIIDYTKVQNLYGDSISFAYKLKLEIKNELGFTVNIGIANNRLCAKMASDFLKPDKVHTLFNNEIEEKMYPLAVENLYGVGKSSTEKLKNLNINTIGELANSDYSILYKYFKNQTLKLINAAKGIDDGIVTQKKEDSECISNSITTSYNLTTLDEIYEYLAYVIDNTCMILNQKNKYTTLVTVFIKDKNFKIYSHQKKLLNPTRNVDDINSVARVLIRELWNKEEVRLVGISLGKFTTSINYQLSIFESPKEVHDNNVLNETIEKLKTTYGQNIINKASKYKK